MDLIGKKLEFVQDHINRLINEDNKLNSKAEIARMLGIKSQYLNSILTGKRNVSDQFFKKFIKTFQINQYDLSEIDREEKIFIEKLNKKTCDNCDKKDQVINNLKSQIELLKSNEKELNLISKLSAENALLKKEINDLKSERSKHAAGYGHYAAEP